MESFPRRIHLAPSLRPWQCRGETYVCGSQLEGGLTGGSESWSGDAVCPGERLPASQPCHSERMGGSRGPCSSQGTSAAAQPCTWPVLLLLVCWPHGTHSPALCSSLSSAHICLLSHLPTSCFPALSFIVWHSVLCRLLLGH